MTGLYQDQQVINLIRSRLTRGLGNTLVPAMSDTASDFINMSLQDSQDRQYANGFDNPMLTPYAGWLALPAFDFMSRCSSRITARIFLGVSRGLIRFPLRVLEMIDCNILVTVHDEEYLQLSEDWAHGILNVSSMLNAAPAFCRRWVMTLPPRLMRELILKH